MKLDAFFQAQFDGRGFGILFKAGGQVRHRFPCLVNPKERLESWGHVALSEHGPLHTRRTSDGSSICLFRDPQDTTIYRLRLGRK
jgi:hypothetical protein